MKKILLVLESRPTGETPANEPSKDQPMYRRRLSLDSAIGFSMAAIVTPMLDMAFQILSFFIMTYHPSAFEGHVSASLTPIPQAQPAPNAPAPKSVLAMNNGPLELDDVASERISIFLKQAAGNDGTPAQILLQRGADGSPQVVADRNAETFGVGLAELERRLREAVREGVESPRVRIHADGEIRQNFVVQTFDRCRKAGLSKIGFVPPPLKAAK